MNTTAVVISQWCAELQAREIRTWPSVSARRSETPLWYLEVNVSGTIYSTEADKWYGLVCLSSFSKMPQTGWLINGRNLVLTVRRLEV